MSTDGSTNGHSGLAGGGGIIRNDRGEWVARFSRNIGYATSFIAELLWALRDGLNLCKNFNLLSVKIDIDAKAIIYLLVSSSDANKMPFHLLMIAGK